MTEVVADLLREHFFTNHVLVLPLQQKALCPGKRIIALVVDCMIAQEVVLIKEEAP